MPDIDYALATRRLYRFTIAIGVFGLPVAAVRGGISSTVGFALGAAGALVNLWLWQRVTARIGPESSPARPVTTDKSSIPAPVRRGPSATSLTARVLALFAGGYVIVRALNVNGLAVLCGLLASTVAALVEILYELFLLRRSGSQ
jgi:hypothetical protein